MKSNGKPVSVYLSPSLIQRLDDLSDIMKVSRSSLIQEFLDKGLSYYEELIRESEEREAAERNKAMHPKIKNITVEDPHDAFFRRFDDE